MKCVTWEAFMLRNLITSKSYLMVHFKEPDDFLHVVAVETLQWSITFPFSMRAYERKQALRKLRNLACKLTSKYPKSPELKSPAGKPIAIMFSVIYVMSKSNPPS